MCLSPGSEVYSRDVLDSFLSRALNVELENKRLGIVDDSAYVLTLDYTIKMLNIHERHECGIPVIIEGETGVGKTALVEMLSKLWNQSLLLEWTKQKGRLTDFIHKKLGDCPGDMIPENYQVRTDGTSGDLQWDKISSLPHSYSHSVCVVMCVMVYVIVMV